MTLQLLVTVLAGVAVGGVASLLLRDQPRLWTVSLGLAGGAAAVLAADRLGLHPHIGATVLNGPTGDGVAAAAGAAAAIALVQAVRNSLA